MNMKKSLFVFTLALALVSVACGQPKTPKQASFDGMKPMTKEVNKTTLNQDIAQMLIVGFRGTTLEKDSRIVRAIQKYGIGGVILFEYDAPTGTHHRNIVSPDQLKKLCADLQQYAGGKLLIGIDQEGGSVTRLKQVDGFTTIPSAEHMATVGIDSVIEYAAQNMKLLQSIGINLNFAPCADVNVNPKSPAIGKLGRSFSSDPETVALCCRKWIELQTSGKIISCLKHFPGHGSAAGDTHKGLVDVTDSWTEVELEPYRTLIREMDVPMIMMAHVVNKNFDPQYPASLSKGYTTEMLRKNMGFKGVIITDDMAMGAIVKQYGYDEALRLALEAGADMLCLGNNGVTYDDEIVEKTINIISNLVKEGKIDASRIRESAKRIREMKSKFGIDVQ